MKSTIVMRWQIGQLVRFLALLAVFNLAVGLTTHVRTVDLEQQLLSPAVMDLAVLDT